MIRILPIEVVNQIAAGEVVDRPAHLVKELVENSLDAGATSISVDVDDGGREVSVEDNGLGLNAADLELALTRFSTSKISTSADLWKLSSFGFRGEALASVASVSKMTLISTARGSAQGARVDSEFGAVQSRSTQPAGVGTQIRVQGLFANTPARLKFLKSPAAEVAALRQSLKALALAHPKVEFRFRVKSNLDSYWCAQKDFLKRAQEILEAPELMLATSEFEGVKVTAAVAPADITMKVNRGLWFFVQNRWVQDKTLQAAVMESYRSSLMHGEYPIAAICIELPPDEVDVNIHPTKSQVKFLNSARVFRAVTMALKPKLESYKSAERLVPMELPETFPMRSPEFSSVQYRQKSSFNYEIPRPSAPPSADNLATTTKNIEVGHWSQLQVLGQTHLTYILAQSKDHLVLIDQHAAHERVMFETLKKQYQEKRIDAQKLLFPLAIEMAPELIEALESQAEHLRALAFEVTRLGPQTLGIEALPSLVRESSLGPLFEKLAHEIVETGGRYNLEKNLDEIFSRLACHSAIRAGQAMSLDDMRALLAQMDEFSFSSFCPHGRPVSVSWSIFDIEKDFGRRV